MRELRPALEQRFERAPAFDPGKLMAKAEVNAGAERDVAVRPAAQIDMLRVLVCGGVDVGGHQHRHHQIAALQRHAAQLHVVAHEARLGELHRRDEAQEFLDREVGAAPVLFQPVAQSGCFSSSNTEPLIRCVVVSCPANSSRKTVAIISSRLMRPPSLLDPHELGDEARAALARTVSICASR